MTPLALAPIVVSDRRALGALLEAYFGGLVPLRQAYSAYGRRYEAYVEPTPRQGVVVVDVTALAAADAAPAGQLAVGGNATAGLGWALVAVAGLLGLMWLNRPERQ